MKTLFFVTAITLLAFPAYAEEIRYDLNVTGMTCAACVARAEKEFKEMEGVVSVNTDLDTETVSLCTDETVVFKDEQLKALFLEKGFTYKGMARQEQC